MSSAMQFGAECHALLEDLGDLPHSRGVVRYWKLQEMATLIKGEIQRVVWEAQGIDS